MSRLASSYNESRPADPAAARPGFVPWEGDALGDRDTTPYAITERLPPTAPARVRTAPPAPPRPVVVTASRWRVPMGVLIGLVIVVAVITLGVALAQRNGGGKRLLAAAGGGSAARIPLPRNG